jgi:signal peptidase II
MSAPLDTGARGGGAAARSRTYRLLFGVVVAVWLIADQLTKTWAEDRLRTGDIDIVGSLRFNLAYNTGASFGLGSGYGAWISVVALAVVALLVWQGSSVRSRLGAVALGMIVGGAVGNVLDRAFRGTEGFMSGRVVDFIDVQWWPIFNVADIGIVCGGILLIASVLFGPSDDEPVAPGDGTDAPALGATEHGGPGRPTDPNDPTDPGPER